MSTSSCTVCVLNYLWVFLLLDMMSYRLVVVLVQHHIRNLLNTLNSLVCFVHSQDSVLDNDMNHLHNEKMVVPDFAKC